SAMLAVAAGEAAVAESLAGIPGQVGIAAVNGPAAVVVSGDAEAVDTLAALWADRGTPTHRLRVSHAFHSAHMEPMLAEFAAVAEGLTFRPPTVPIVSNLTGRIAEPEQLCRPDYWVRHVREAVRFADAVDRLAGAGVGTYVELGPGGVLTAMAESCLADPAAVLVPLVRKDRAEPRGVLEALARLHTEGLTVDWDALLAGARPVDLPTYAFQHERYWLEPVGRLADVSGAGLGAAGHPLLGAAVSVAGEDMVLLTGRLSLATHPWLADHAVADVVVLPGAALVELVVRAGDEVGVSRLRELTVAAPLVLPASGGVRVQVRVGPADVAGARAVTVHAQAEGDPEAGWVRHAEGVLEPAAADGPGLPVWPPTATEVDPDTWYAALAGHGLAYGPAFRGLRRLWTGDGEVHAEVALPEEVAAGAGGFGVHPALLDAALHPVGLLLAGDGGGPRVPFAFEGVQVHASGAATLRVRVSRDGDAVRLVAVDETGAPVVSVDSLVLRELTGVTAPGAAARSMFEVVWQAEPVAPVESPSGWALLAANGAANGAATAGDVTAEPRGGLPRYPDVPAVLAALEAGADAPRVLVLPVSRLSSVDAPAAGRSGVDVPADVVATASDVLGVVQAWLAADALADSRLVVLTRGAVAAREGDPVTDLAGAAVWGLLRSAQSEHPERIVLADLDGDLDEGVLAVLAGVA
ncbi:polyketide synthase dehydratase domain-containing protein, partial [Micromonospora chersina]